MALDWTLSDEERHAIETEAYRRQSVNEAKGLQGRNNAPEKGAKSLRMHMLGAAGEMAVASFLGMKDKVFADLVAKRGSFDLPPNIDVKTRGRHKYDLVCQLDEDPNKILVLVTIEQKLIIIHGWVQAREAMQEKWKQEYVKNRPAYFLPKKNLRSIQSLKRLLDLENERSL